MTEFLKLLLANPNNVFMIISVAGAIWLYKDSKAEKQRMIAKNEEREDKLYELLKNDITYIKDNVADGNEEILEKIEDLDKKLDVIINLSQKKDK
jgi:uncharacterized membrane protein